MLRDRGSKTTSELQGGKIASISCRNLALKEN